MLLFLARLPFPLWCVYLLNSPYFLLIFVSLLKSPAPTAHFPSSEYPHLHSSLLFLSFQSFFQLLPQPSHPFGITSYFLFHFLLQKMFLDPFPKIFGMKPYSCRSVFPLGASPKVFHRPGALGLHTSLGLALSIMFIPVPHSRKAMTVVIGLVSLAPSGSRLLCSYHFQKVCMRYEKSRLLLFLVSEKEIRWREGMLSQQYSPSWDVFLNV